MRINCAVLGFLIDRAACGASGNNPLCRKCREVQDQEETPALPLDGKRGVRKRCECGRIFFSKSNRQQFCQKCQKGKDTLKNREYQARFRKK